MCDSVKQIWPPRSKLFLLWVVMALAVGQGCESRDVKAWVARVKSAYGDVTASVAPGARTQVARAGLSLQLGARLETGRESGAMLALRGGGRMEVKADSVLVFRSTGDDKTAGHTQTELVLEAGKVVGHTTESVTASSLIIFVGQQRVRLKGAAQATVQAGNSAADSKLVVVFGEATVDEPANPSMSPRTVVAGDELAFSLGSQRVTSADASLGMADANAEDAGISDAESSIRDASEATLSPDGSEKSEVLDSRRVVAVRRLNGGRVIVTSPGAGRGAGISRRRTASVPVGSEIKLAARARVLIKFPDGRQSVVTGPSALVVADGGPNKRGSGGVLLKSVGRSLSVSGTGVRGKGLGVFSIDGVRIAVGVTHRRINLVTRRRAEGVGISVSNGEARLVERGGRTVRVEAGQRATIKEGRVIGPITRPSAALKVRKASTLRVFAAERKTPVTFTWRRPTKSFATLIEVSRDASFRRPIFSDVIKRNRLTLTVGRGRVFWQLRHLEPGGALGEKQEGRVLLLRDTSYRVLRNRRAPKNTIHEDFGNTTVYYQNSLPRFMFRWNTVPEARSYRFKLYRAAALTEPVVSAVVNEPSIVLRSGKVGEGQYLWYVGALSAAGTLIKSTSSRRLRIRFDNATPDLQILYPKSGLTVATPQIEVRGVTIPGSQVLVNGVSASLDNTSRFNHRVVLKKGANDIIFRVVDRKRGSSVYLRRVIRR